MPWRTAYSPVLSWSLSLALHAGAIGAAWQWRDAWIDRDAELGARQGMVTILASVGHDSPSREEPVTATIEAPSPAPPSPQPQAAAVEKARQASDSQQRTTVEATAEPTEIHVAELPKAEISSSDQPADTSLAPATPTARAASAPNAQLPGLSVPLELGLASASDPHFFHNVPPAYPAEAQRRGWQGTVLLRLSIDESGRVAEARVERSSGFELLDDTALQAVRHWRAQPAVRRGRAVSTTAFQPIVFRLPK